jgi:hypothetical protein
MLASDHSYSSSNMMDEKTMEDKAQEVSLNDEK